MSFKIQSILDANDIIPTSVCFTGCRPDKLCGYNKQAYISLNNQLKDIIKQLILAGTIKFISGGAQGFDQLAFWMVSSVKDENKYRDIQNVLYIPFEGQEQKWAEQGTFSQAEYQQMFMFANEVKYVTNTKANDSYNEIVKALYARNEAMVNATDLTVALYPSLTWDKDKNSGTASCIRYAHTHNKPVLQLQYEMVNNIPVITHCIMYK